MFLSPAVFKGSGIGGFNRDFNRHSRLNEIVAERKSPVGSVRQVDHIVKEKPYVVSIPANDLGGMKPVLKKRKNTSSLKHKNKRRKRSADRKKSAGRNNNKTSKKVVKRKQSKKSVKARQSKKKRTVRKDRF